MSISLQIRYLKAAILDPRQSQPGGSPIDLLVVHRPGTATKAAKAALKLVYDSNGKCLYTRGAIISVIV